MTERTAAFERLWREEYGQVFRTAFLMTGDRQEAEDLAQEAFSLAWRKWGRVASYEHPGAWVQTAVAKMCLNWRRRQKRRLHIRFEPPRASSDTEVLNSQLEEGLKSLTPSQRTVVVLRYYLDLPVDEVARVLHKKPGTVRALTSQALQRLRPVLSEREIAHVSYKEG